MLLNLKYTKKEDIFFQRKRINAIRNERRRKYRNGEIAEAFEKNFPEFGQYKPDYFSHNRVQ